MEHTPKQEPAHTPKQRPAVRRKPVGRPKPKPQEDD